jgi:hypothetical protein
MTGLSFTLKTAVSEANILLIFGIICVSFSIVVPDNLVLGADIREDFRDILVEGILDAGRFETGLFEDVINYNMARSIKTNLLILHRDNTCVNYTDR